MKPSPAYEKIKEWLLDIASNPESNTEIIPSERQICKIHKVSRDTVRKAINNLTDEGILEPKQGMGTYINRKIIDGHQQRINRNLTVGIIIYQGTKTYQLGNYVWGILQEAINNLGSQGIKIQFISLNNGIRNNSNGGKSTLTAREIAAQDVDGVIWISPGENVELINQLKEKDIPVILIGRIPVAKRIHYIVSDDYYGGFIGTEHLIKHGHYNILFVSKTDGRPFIEERFRGFHEALHKYGFKPDPKLIIENLDIPDVYTAIRKKIRSKNNFSGIFIADGIFLRTVYNALRDEGKVIPDDFSVISYDKSMPGECPGIELTEVCQPLEKIGKTAAQKMLKILNNRQNGTVETILKPRLEKGNSVLDLSH